MRRATDEAQLRNWDAFAVGYLTTMLTVYKSFNTPSDTELKNIARPSSLTDSNKEMIRQVLFSLPGAWRNESLPRGGA